MANWFRKRLRAARARALERSMDERANAEANLVLDDQQFHGLSDAATLALLERRLGTGNKSSGYKSAIGEGFEFEDE